MEYGQALFEQLLSAPRQENEGSLSIRSRENIIRCEAKDSFLTLLYRGFGMPRRAVDMDEDSIFVEEVPVSHHTIGEGQFAIWLGSLPPNTHFESNR